MTTGRSIQLARVVAAIDGDVDAIDDVRRHGAVWDRAWLRRAVAAAGGPTKLGVVDPPPRRPARPRLPAAAAPHAVAAACARWAATYTDDSVAVGAMVRCARDHGVDVDRATARRILRALRAVRAV